MDVNRYKKALTYLVTAGIAAICAVNYHLFIFPNQFAPAGINGICTMIQYVFGINVGYLSLIINIPLAIAVYLLVSKPLAVRSMVYVVVFSTMLIVLEYVDISDFQYITDSGTSKILGPLAAGVIYGYCYRLLLQCSACGGGTDFIAAIIHRSRPHLNLISIIFTLNVIVAVVSYFVYGYQVEPVILCILYCFTSSTLSDKLNKSGRSAVRFEIVTEHPEEISDAIIHQLHHSATLVPGRGLYRGRETNILICVVNKSQVAALAALVRSYPNTFAVMTQVSEVVGNFKKIDAHGHPEVSILDSGDGESIT